MHAFDVLRHLTATRAAGIDRHQRSLFRRALAAMN
jgi:hypothetical protein